MDKGTDAPKFVILNVIPGRPDSALKTRAGRFKKEITTRIGHKVAEMMQENDRKGVSNLCHDYNQALENFTLTKGKGYTQEILEI